MAITYPHLSATPAEVATAKVTENLEAARIAPPSALATTDDATLKAIPTIGVTKLVNLPKMADRPKITTWSLQKIKQFADWCQTHQLSKMSGQLEPHLLVLPQDTIDVMETIVLEKRVEENHPRLPLQSLQLTEILWCLKSGCAPNVGSGYNKSDTLTGNLVEQTKTLIPETCEAAIAMQKEIRVIMNVCPEGIKGDIDIVRAEFRTWATGIKASSQLDDGGALSLKTKFVNFMKVGSHGKEIEDYKEIGERLLI